MRSVVVQRSLKWVFKGYRLRFVKDTCLVQVSWCTRVWHQVCQLSVILVFRVGYLPPSHGWGILNIRGLGWRKTLYKKIKDGNPSIKSTRPIGGNSLEVLPNIWAIHAYLTQVWAHPKAWLSTRSEWEAPYAYMRHLAKCLLNRYK
jgi:hypothetical protein